MNRLVCIVLVLLLSAIGVVPASAQQVSTPAAPQPSTPIPPITEEDRAAAFPDLGGHTTHDKKVFSYVLFDQLEWRSADENGEDTVGWNTIGWVGGDINRVWLWTEGESTGSRLRDAEAHVLYGRAFSRWWDFVAGVRQDFRPGPARTWSAVGIQGLAPYFFELQATAYVGESWRTQARIEAEYEMLLTNRLILQPRGEINLVGKADPERGIGSGLSTAELGFRLRYEFRREFAPYVGIEWRRQFGGTADFSRANGEDIGATRLVAGLRFWF
jgi:copper resistance protein B